MADWRLVRATLEPHFDRLGAIAGGRLDELACIADKNPPVLHPRDRQGRDQDWIEYHPAYREMEQIAFGDFQFHAMSHRGGVLGLDAPLPPVAKYAFVYLFVQAEFGIMCPVSVSDTFILMTKELTMLGFFTSEVGATQVLQYVPVPGSYKGCVPLSEAGNGKAWAT